MPFYPIFCDSYWWTQTGLNYPIVLAFAIFSCFVFGSCFGSFMNVVIWRMPRRESIVNAPSHCTTCGTDIRWYDNLPIISYLVLRGKCRVCHTPYSPRYLFLEAAIGILFVAIFLRIGLANLPYQLLLPGFCTIFFAVSASWIDAKHRIIPDNLNYSFLVIGLVLAAVFPTNWQTKIWYIALIKSLISCLITTIILATFTFVGRFIFKKEALGLGDVKYMAATASLLGIYAVYFALLIGAITGSIYGIYTIIKSKRKANKIAIPFGPFLSLGTMLWIFSAPWCFNFLLKLIGKN